jgi:AraC-like DNA-binding protein
MTALTVDPSRLLDCRPNMGTVDERPVTGHNALLVSPEDSTMSQDTLSEVLRSIRLRGAVFYYVDGAEPWAAEAPPARDIAAAIMPAAEHVMEYHVVTRGSCWGAVVGQPPVRLEQGDVIVFPQGDAHVISSAPGMRAPVDTGFYFQPRPEQLPFILSQHAESVTTARLDGGGAAQATVACGFLGCDARPFNPLIATLPRVLHVPARGAADGNGISEFVRLAVTESNRKRPGGEALLERLSEMMFVEVVRRYLEGLPEGQTGWLAGLRDRFVGRALALLHDRPADPWTMEMLADKVGLSRSALHERFVQFVGQPPMQYLANWRMQVASGVLTQTNANIASVALEVGYESEAAFSRAFRRATGLPPAAWRRERAQLRRPAGSSG